jgi:Domain of unknown function (DUF4288)
MRWFGVRTLYRWKPSGRPKKRDSRYRAGHALLEDRVVLFRARSFRDALMKAEREAARYVARESQNTYGQRITMTYLGTADAYEMTSDPVSGGEAYSSTELVSAAESPGSLIARKFGRDDRALRRQLAPMFMEAAIHRDLEAALAHGRAKSSQPTRR